MIKYKIERGGGRTFLVIQGQKGQQISEREYYAIHTGQIPGLLRADVVNKGSTFKINYNISGYISLREFLLNPLNKQSFSSLLTCILRNLKALQTAYYNMQYILMDVNTVMVNPANHDVSFVYVPITFFESGTNLKYFLLSIINHCSFLPGEQTDYVRDYIRILNQGINFSVFDLEEYLKKLSSKDSPDKKIKKCQRCGAVLQPGVNFCSSCGLKNNVKFSANENTIYDPLRNIPIPQPNPVQEREMQTPPQAPPQAPPPQMPPQVPSQMPPQAPPQMPPQVPPQMPPQAPPQVLEPDPVTIQVPHKPNGGIEQNNQAYNGYDAGRAMAGGYNNTTGFSRTGKAFLFRVKTGEQIEITQTPFKIGKDPYNNNYCVADNPAISRNHAVVSCLNNRWFINDMRSTNKTYVNDLCISSGVETEITNGTNIKLADERFVFSIN